MNRKTKSFAPVVVAIAIVALCLQAAVVLRWFASQLSDGTPIGDFQYVGVLDGHGSPDGYDALHAAVDLSRERSLEGVLLVLSPPSRVVEAGIVPPMETTCRESLLADGVRPERIEVIRCDGHDDCAKARAIRDWMVGHPGARICLLCGNFRSACLRRELKLTLDPEQAARVSLQELPEPDVDAQQWWSTRSGVKRFGIAWLLQLHNWCIGKSHLPDSQVSADEYERRFLEEQSQRKPCE